jgi:hypothetical protein
MARGWESKSVESQIEDRNNVQHSRGEKRPVEEIEREQKRDSIEMSRRGVVRELEAAKSPLRRSSLEQALKHLDELLSKVK